MFRTKRNRQHEQHKQPTINQRKPIRIGNGREERIRQTIRYARCCCCCCWWNGMDSFTTVYMSGGMEIPKTTEPTEEAMRCTIQRTNTHSLQSKMHRNRRFNAMDFHERACCTHVNTSQAHASHRKCRIDVKTQHEQKPQPFRCGTVDWWAV